ncbi:hypothetical protein Nepgr_007614 [Nepenthes gracilis]|uniref:Lipid-binding serum glycoprotein C-terminal domain-containing protein n=1 Tax=Nepenthes gracilis TaxID=150966 RepID=A0AAD3XIH7_NEPGR|nr:hypothetical protein Nepgr_007614 [Nepenthes gracilis]
MAASVLFIFFIFLSQLYTPSIAHLQSLEGFISLSVSEKGLDFVKDLLIDRAVSALTPIELPQIERHAKIPVVGKVHIVLSDIIIDHIDISSSFIESGEAGVAIAASGATANLSMNWKYSYKTWLIPIEVSDEGKASVQVERMEVGLVASMKNHEGNLRLSLTECVCSVEDIIIKLDGGASWLYQGVVDAFGNRIESAVEDAVVKKIEEGIFKMDSILQSLPKEIPVDDISALNVTFVYDPFFSESSVDFNINGLFIERSKALTSQCHHGKSQAFASCNGSSKMVAITLREEVFNSASLTYFYAGVMNWTVHKIPDQSILNTADWRYAIPQLYDLFPDDEMNLNVSASSPPIINVFDDHIDATIYADVIIGVLDNSKAMPVACISLVITASGFVEISGNNLTGSIKLDGITSSLKWSKIGDLPLNQIQAVILTVFEAVLLPRLNLHLMHGFPLPLFRGLKLQNAKISCTKSKITVCSDVEFMEIYKFLAAIQSSTAVFSQGPYDI